MALERNRPQQAIGSLGLAHVARTSGERAGIEAAWSAAATALGEHALQRFDRAGRSASEPELATLI